MIGSAKALISGLLLIVISLILAGTMNLKFYNGNSANQVIDSVFRSMRKGLVPPFKELEVLNRTFLGKNYVGTLTFPDIELARKASSILLKNKLLNEPNKRWVTIKGDLGYTLSYFLRDIRQLYYNRGDVLEARYSMPAKESMYIVSLILKAISHDLKSKNLNSQKIFVDAIRKKALIPSYNMFGTAPLNIVTGMTILSTGTLVIIFFSLLWGLGIITILRTIDQKGFYNQLRYDFVPARKNRKKKSTNKKSKNIAAEKKSGKIKNTEKENPSIAESARQDESAVDTKHSSGESSQPQIKKSNVAAKTKTENSARQKSSVKTAQSSSRKVDISENKTKKTEPAGTQKVRLKKAATAKPKNDSGKE